MSISTASRKTTRPRGYIVNYTPQTRTRELLEQVDEILEANREHWPLTCRQIFYRLVAAYGAEKTERNYGRICHHLNLARRGRYIPFEAIRDDGVTTIHFSHYASTDDFLASYKAEARRYRRDMLAGQSFHAEVWCEAKGMIEQLAKVTEPYSVPVFSTSGFDSTTARKGLAERICRRGKHAVIMHLGDYDPSGESIYDALAEDVTEFVEADRPHGMVSCEFRRIALTAEQVAEYRLPTSPAKNSDSRAKSWSGGTCQLEALTPAQIADILRNQIESLFDPALFANDRMQEREDRRVLNQLLLAGPKT
ncbi:hypothetical protein ACSMXM_04850 [Pacificimonas sp. ICDLI1SI03]